MLTHERMIIRRQSGIGHDTPIGAEVCDASRRGAPDPKLKVTAIVADRDFVAQARGMHSAAAGKIDWKQQQRELRRQRRRSR